MGTSSALITSLVILIALFFILRNVIIWYYKIDKRLDEQKETNRLLKELIDIHGRKTEEQQS